MTLRIASYNLHKCVGADRRRDPARVLEVINQIGADVIALQEVDLRLGARPAALPASLITAHSDYIHLDHHPRTGPDSLGWHGQAILVKRGMRVLSIEGLALPGLEPRGAIVARVSAETGQPFTLIGAHLGLRRMDRRAQWHKIAAELAAASPAPALAIGDFNEWQNARGFEALTGFHVHTPGATYPARLPFGRLDRIVTCGRLRITRMGVFDSPLARRASDHLPIWADCAGILTPARPLHG